MTEELLFTRIFDAPRELVFQCMTSAEHLTHFWGPSGTTAPLDGITVECRPGGRFEVLMRGPDGGSYLMRVVYEEVSAPERLVWNDVDNGTRTSSTFTDLGDNRTQVQIRQTNAPDFMLTPEARAGFLTSLDKLSRYLLSLSAKDAR
jgi:uncharacterized protein YndB with AHSA1/START domain